MEGVDMTLTPHTTDPRDVYEHMLPSNGHVLDARRSAHSPEQFTATYDQARSLMQEAGQSMRHQIASTYTMANKFRCNHRRHHEIDRSILGLLPNWYVEIISY